MTQDNDRENGSNGKKTIEIEVNRKTFAAASKIADSRNESIERFARHSLQTAVGKSEAKELLQSACEDGKLSEHFCRHLEKKEEEHHSF
jgi:hypothetical protein